MGQIGKYKLAQILNIPFGQLGNGSIELSRNYPIQPLNI